MGIIKIYFFFYLSYWLRLLLIVCGDVESNHCPGSDKMVRVHYPTFVVFMPIWMSWLLLYRIMMFWCVLIGHLSELRIPGFVTPYPLM